MPRKKRRAVPYGPPLIEEEPACFENAEGQRQRYTVHYKDEGGKDAHVPLLLHLLEGEQQFSVVAVLHCEHCEAGEFCHRDARKSESGGSGGSGGCVKKDRLVTLNLFKIQECTTLDEYPSQHARRKEVQHPWLLNPGSASGAWRKFANVYTLNSPKQARRVLLRCRFNAVSVSMRCHKCSQNKTQYRVVVRTDHDREAWSVPIWVKSKRKIPADKRDMSAAEIRDFKARRKTLGGTTTPKVFSKHVSANRRAKKRAKSEPSVPGKLPDTGTATICAPCASSCSSGAETDLILQNVKLAAKVAKLKEALERKTADVEVLRRYNIHQHAQFEKYKAYYANLNAEMQRQLIRLHQASVANEARIKQMADTFNEFVEQVHQQDVERAINAGDILQDIIPDAPQPLWIPADPDPAQTLHAITACL